MPVTFSDQERLDELVRWLEVRGFHAPKWSYRFNVPIGELAPCSRRKFLCDVIAYRDGIPVIAFELDGKHHVEEAQERLDEQKEHLLSKHGIRTWRMWNGELVNMRIDEGRIFRRFVKAQMYAPHGTLATDWKKLCACMTGGR